MSRRKTLEQIEAAIARWQSKQKRAVNAIERLTKQRKRMLAKVPSTLEPAYRKPVEKPAEPSTKPPAPADLAIPDFLRRTGDTPEAAAIKAEQAELKRRKSAGRIAKMKAKASGATRAMPLTGKAALAAIRSDTGAKSP